MREVGKRDAENIQGVWKILPLKKVEQYFWSQDILYERGNPNKGLVLRPCSSSSHINVVISSSGACAIHKVRAAALPWPR